LGAYVSVFEAWGFRLWFRFRDQGFGALELFLRDQDFGDLGFRFRDQGFTQ
jgi:hypothetical protein